LWEFGEKISRCSSQTGIFYLRTVSELPGRIPEWKIEVVQPDHIKT
jgi:hypothetical protein